jgi:hypothetical protein
MVGRIAILSRVKTSFSPPVFDESGLGFGLLGSPAQKSNGLLRSRRLPAAPLMAISARSHYFRRHPLNLRHVVVKNGLLAAIIPFDSYARPIGFNNGAQIRCRGSPANAVADVQLSGLVAGHFVPLWGLAALAKIDFILPRHCDCDSDSLAVL